MGDTSIQWTGKTINPIKARRKSDGKKGWACVRVSPGCERCYSETQNKQCGNNSGRHGTGLAYTVPALEQVELYLDEDVLLEPLRWREPTNVFPCSMTDWMAEFVLDEWRDKMLAVMALTPQHTYQTLTKRADRQLEYLRSKHEGVLTWAMKFSNRAILPSLTWPLRNLWLGVSVEDQPRADERIPLLLQTPAAIRWVSLEPLLGDLDIVRYLGHRTFLCKCGFHETESELTFIGLNVYYCQECKERCTILPAIDWGVIGLESGSKARQGKIAWIRHLLPQFEAAGVPVFVKQLGGNLPDEDLSECARASGTSMHDSKGGDPSEWPKDLRVREYPAVRG